MTRVLIIDDDDDLRKTLMRMLTSAGFEVIGAKDGREGLARFRSASPDVVLTDVIMPDQDGIETIIAVRKASPTMPIIAISGGGRAQTMQFLSVAGKLGADLVLRKPIKQLQLLEAILRLLKRETERRNASS